MDWVSVWADVVGGLLIAGAMAAWVPHAFWQSLFLVDHPVLASLWGPIVGPLVAIISFVCSVGNITQCWLQVRGSLLSRETSATKSAISGLMRCSKTARHSITLPARSRIAFGSSILDQGAHRRVSAGPMLRLNR
jgi:hypothetical protein